MSPHDVPFGLPPSQVVDLLPVEDRGLLELDLYELIVPLRYWGLHISLDGVGRVRPQLPVAEDRRRALVVPHADGRSGGVTEESERMRVDAGDDPFFLHHGASGRQDL